VELPRGQLESNEEYQSPQHTALHVIQSARQRKILQKTKITLYLTNPMGAFKRIAA
jgi:hypothetical protein